MLVTAAWLFTSLLVMAVIYRAVLTLAYLVGPVLGLGLTAIWGANVFYRQVQSGVFVWLWRRGQWATIKV